MSAMVQIFSWGARWNVPFNEAKPSWMVHFIFHQMKIFVSLHEWENIHYLFYITCGKIQILKKKKEKEKKRKEKAMKNDFSSSKTFQKLCVQLYAGSITRTAADACIMLNTRTAPIAVAPRRASHVVFLNSLISEQTSEDCYWTL